jgi:hypothetical protein
VIGLKYEYDDDDLRAWVMGYVVELRLRWSVQSLISEDTAERAERSAIASQKLRRSALGLRSLVIIEGFVLGGWRAWRRCAVEEVLTGTLYVTRFLRAGRWDLQPYQMWSCTCPFRRRVSHFSHQRPNMPSHLLTSRCMVICLRRYSSTCYSILEVRQSTQNRIQSIESKR